jgi:predicted RNA-binding protein with TRAM domain
MKLFSCLFILLLIGCVSVDLPKTNDVQPHKVVGRYYDGIQFKYANFILLVPGATNGVVVSPELYAIEGQTNFYWLKKYNSYDDALIGPQPATFGITDIKIE